MPSKKAASKVKSAKPTRTSTAPHDPTASDDVLGPRRITPASYASRFRRTKAARKVARNKLPNSFKILYRSVRMLTDHWNIFGGVLLIYTLINLLLIGGFSSGTSL